MILLIDLLEYMKNEREGGEPPSTLSKRKERK